MRKIVRVDEQKVGAEKPQNDLGVGVDGGVDAHKMELD